MTAAIAQQSSATAADTAKYNLNINPVYQIDVTTASTGKMVAQTKRRVRWRFGFSNAEAIKSGSSGTDCRGEEHEVTLIWSLTSGKRLVLMDGKEVHFSMGKPTSGKFQTSWTMRGNHVLKIVAYAAPPIKNRPGFKQFELFLDGMGFNGMPKIYELGVKAGGAHARSLVPRESASHTQQNRQPVYNNYSLPTEEENAWARRVESYEDRRSIDNPAPVPTEVAASTDLMSAPVSTPGQDYLNQPNALLDNSAPVVGAAPPQPDFDFTPQVAPAPTYNDVAGSVLGLYGGGANNSPPAQETTPLPALPPSTSAPVVQQQQYYQEPAPPQQQYYQEPAPQQLQFTEQQYEQQYEQQPQYEEKAVVTPLKPIQNVENHTESPQGVADLDDVTKAMKNLVNFDDINENPVNEELSMYSSPFADKNHLRDDQRKVKSGPTKSKGITATSKEFNMAGRSLNEVKSMHGGGVRKPPTKEVMKTHAFDPAAAQAGMMVVYGAPQQQPQAPAAYANYQVPGMPMQQQQPVAAPQHDFSQGPPPLGPQAGTGFGLGRTLPGGGYGAPPQQQPVYATR